MTPTLAFALGGPYDIAIVFGMLLLIAVPTLFWIVEIVDAVRRQFPTVLVKAMWLLVIICIPVLGALVYYFVGKKQGILPTEPKAAPRAA